MPQTKLQKRIKAYRKLTGEIRILEGKTSFRSHDEHLLRVKRFDLENLREKIPQPYRWEFGLIGEFAP